MGTGFFPGLGKLLFGTHSASTPTRLTADGEAANANNIWVVPQGVSQAFRIRLFASNVETPGTDYFSQVSGIVHRPGAAATVTVDLGTPEAVSNGTTTGAAVAITADTTLGGISITFDPPTGNTDKWNFSAQMDILMEQAHD